MSDYWDYKLEHIDRWMIHIKLLCRYENYVTTVGCNLVTIFIKEVHVQPLQESLWYWINAAQFHTCTYAQISCVQLCPDYILGTSLTIAITQTFILFFLIVSPLLKYRLKMHNRLKWTKVWKSKYDQHRFHTCTKYAQIFILWTSLPIATTQTFVTKLFFNIASPFLKYRLRMYNRLKCTKIWKSK